MDTPAGILFLKNAICQFPGLRPTKSISYSCNVSLDMTFLAPLLVDNEVFGARLTHAAGHSSDRF